ncbi:MAG: hypothetical protein ABEN55_08580, partial [Bradymonadaceae bacterium]
VTSETESREEYSLYQMHIDHDGAFTAGGESATTRLSLRLNLDRLLAKVEMMGTSVPRGWRGLFALGQFLQGVELTVDAHDRYRYTRVRFGPYRGGELSLPASSIELAEPSTPPSCLRDARRASKRVYVRHIDSGPYYPDRDPVPGPKASKGKAAKSVAKPQKNPPDATTDEPSAQLGTRERKAIDQLVGKLGDLQGNCEKGAKHIEKLRAYWQGVLDGDIRTYPQESGS